MRRFILALAVVLTALPAAAEPPPALTAPLERGHPLVGTVWRDGQRVTPEALAAEAARADVLLLGETHDNPDHHALQAWLVRALAPRRPVVAFEMIDPDQRAALDAHLAAHPGDAAGLGAALGWDKSGWPDWALYRPIADAALAAGAPLAPANLTRTDVRAIARGEAADLGAPLPPETERAFADEIKDSHCGMLPDKAVAPMVRVQRARDAAMARAIRDARAQGRPVVLIAGQGHTRTDRGVPTHLRPAHRVLAVAFVEVQPGKTGVSDYDTPHDILMFTPRADREDQCEAFKRHMEKKGGK